MNELFETSDGSHSLHSKKYGVSYHSKYGAVQETQHVFIDAALRPKLAEQTSQLEILELGFGTGLNALMTLLEASRKKHRIRYTTVEAFPIPLEMAAQLNYVDLLQAPQFAEAFRKMHELPSAEWTALTDYFDFCKLLVPFQELAFEPTFDIIYFDAFAPNAQPELWEAPLLSAMYAATKPGGLLTTYCAKGAVKRTLRAVGFEVETLPGPPGKREMTRAWKPLTQPN